jgi:hypothetical protein
VHFAAARFQRAPNDLFAVIFLLSGPAFDIVLRLFRTSNNDEPALVSAVDGAGSAMLFSVAAAI